MQCFKYFVAFLPILFVSNVLGELEKSAPLLEINSGRIQGYRALSRDGKEYYAFQAIPYAKPPVDSLRFQPPQPVDKWDGIFDATKDGADCAQWTPLNTAAGTEDCLQLNVYTPQLEKDAEQLFPVLFYIHGGGFAVGGGRNFHIGPDNFMNYPVVLVTINYRVGILGFLSTEDENANGNYGMLDQVLALQWVQENILNFRGDPNRVTIFGMSAGSAAVVYHLLSPLSSGLFHKAIAQSGSVFSQWPFIESPLEVSKMIAKELKCSDVNDAKNIVKCFREKSWEELVLADRRPRVGLFFPNYFAPSVEGKGGPGFLTQNPGDLLRHGKIANKVPTIIGMSATEGYTLFYEFAMHFKSRGKKYFEHEFPEHLPLFTKIQPNMKSAIKAIEDEYYREVDLDDDELFMHVGSLIIGDATLSVDVALTAELLAQAGIPTYAYMLDHIVENCLVKLYGEKCGKYCSHADELSLQFRFMNLTSSAPEDKTMSDILNGLFVSFAYDRELKINEDHKWPLHNVNNRPHVLLSVNPKIKEGLLSDKISFWTETIPKLIKEEITKDEL